MKQGYVVQRCLPLLKHRSAQRKHLVGACGNHMTTRQAPRHRAKTFVPRHGKHNLTHQHDIMVLHAYYLGAISLGQPRRSLASALSSIGCPKSHDTQGHARHGVLERAVRDHRERVLSSTQLILPAPTPVSNTRPLHSTPLNTLGRKNVSVPRVREKEKERERKREREKKREKATFATTSVASLKKPTVTR